MKLTKKDEEVIVKYLKEYVEEARDNILPNEAKRKTTTKVWLLMEKIYPVPKIRHTTFWKCVYCCHIFPFKPENHSHLISFKIPNSELDKFSTKTTIKG